MALTYATLVTQINGYTENVFDTSGSTNIDTIIRQAEQRIYNTVQLPALRRNQTGTLTASNKYLSMPTDFLAPFSLTTIGVASPFEQTFLLQKDVNFIREAFPDPTVTGQPTHYAIFDASTFILGPTPDAAYGAELHYYYYPASITTALTSWLGTNFESVLLSGCLLEAYIYMKGEPELIATYEKRYNEALLLLKRLGDCLDRRDAYRSGQVRDSVK